MVTDIIDKSLSPKENIKLIYRIYHEKIISDYLFYICFNNNELIALKVKELIDLHEINDDILKKTLQYLL